MLDDCKRYWPPKYDLKVPGFPSSLIFFGLWSCEKHWKSCSMSNQNCTDVNTHRCLLQIPSPKTERSLHKQMTCFFLRSRFVVYFLPQVVWSSNFGWKPIQMLSQVAIKFVFFKNCNNLTLSLESKLIKMRKQAKAHSRLPKPFSLWNVRSNNLPWIPELLDCCGLILLSKVGYFFWWFFLERRKGLDAIGCIGSNWRKMFFSSSQLGKANTFQLECFLTFHFQDLDSGNPHDIKIRSDPTPTMKTLYQEKDGWSKWSSRRK